MRRSLICLVTVTFVGSLGDAEAQPRFPDVAPAPEMAQLRYLVGAFAAKAELFDAAGAVSGTLESTTRVRPILGGVGLEQEGRLVGTSMQTRSIYFIDNESSRVTWWSLDSNGNEHVFQGEADAAGMTLVSRPVKTAEGDIRFKRVDRVVDDDSFEYSLYTSRDDGETWTLGNKQMNRRVGSVAAIERASELDALDSYVGEWLGEELREARDGEQYRFRYHLEYFDAARTIVEMKIFEVRDAGEPRLLWHGYKGWNPVASHAYYFGFSPAGRVGGGHLYLDDEGRLVTEYDGWAPTGGAVRVRDVFSHLEPDRFVSVTYMIRDGEWREINRDHWRRVIHR